jgi:hypothetical protein
MPIIMCGTWTPAMLSAATVDRFRGNSGELPRHYPIHAVLTRIDLAAPDAGVRLAADTAGRIYRIAGDA